MQVAHQLRDQKVEVRVPLTVRVGRHVDGHAIDFGGEVRAMIEIEGSKEVLIGLSLPRMLSHDQAGNVLEHGRWPQKRLGGQLTLPYVPGGCRIHVAHTRGHDRYRLKILLGVTGAFVRGVPCVAACGKGWTRSAGTDQNQGKHGGRRPKACRFKSVFVRHDVAGASTPSPAGQSAPATGA